MQEFSSVTASSYDADSLAPLLNEKAADGWSVVSIVAAGTNIVAYLQRDADEHASGPTDTAPTAEPVTEAASVDSIDEDAIDEGAVDESADASEQVDDSPFIPAAAAAVVAEAPTPVDEPAGWASAPDEQAAEPVDTSIADLAAQVSEPEPEPVVTEPVVAEPVVAVAESAVPAGWYADPSGRFELRYWDGSAWTEHVSRAGQQFTDPPVA